MKYMCEETKFKVTEKGEGVGQLEADTEITFVFKLLGKTQPSRL